MDNTSIRNRLLGLILTAVALAWVATTLFSYFDARHETEELFDAHLAQVAAILSAQTGHDFEEIDTEHAPQLHRYARRVAFQVWEHGDTLLLHSANAPDARLSQTETGFSTVSHDKHDWRVFSSWDEKGEFLIQVGERMSAREDVVSGIAKNMLVPLFVALPLLALLIWLTVGSGLRPLHAIGAEVARRQPGDLSPITIETAPVEVKPLLKNLNQLFERVGRAMENERRFTGDASHELRTPLAALRTQAQVAMNAGADAERRHALEAVIAGCDRMTHLVEQLLTLSRLDAAGSGITPGECNLARLARRTVAEQAPDAVAGNRELAYAGPDNANISGHDTYLEVLLNNLVANALRHTPPGTDVTVSVTQDSTGTTLAVTDRGPGIPPDQREKVLQRFTRLAGQDVQGAGLGLSIVARVAELHGATLKLGDAEGGGLKVEVFFSAGSGASHR